MEDQRGRGRGKRETFTRKKLHNSEIHPLIFHGWFQSWKLTVRQHSSHEHEQQTEQITRFAEFSLFSLKHASQDFRKL